MPTTDYRSSSVTLASLGRTLLSIRRDQVHAMDPIGDAPHPTAHDQELLDSFQKRVADEFSELSSATGDNLLSLPWIHRLLDAFLRCQDDFCAILGRCRSLLSRPPLDRLVADYFDRSVKALDVCNAIRDGIEQIRQWYRHVDIVLCALDAERHHHRVLGEGQFRRAKKALTDLAVLMLDDKDAPAALAGAAHRNRSFGRHRPSIATSGHFRSLSWSVSRSWSAARQLQAIGANLAPPRNNEVVATAGLAVPVFTMSSVLLFVAWALVAAIPCQDRGLHAHFAMPRHFPWAAPILSLHDRIFEESKKRDRNNSCALLREIHLIDKCARHMTELVDSAHFPLSEDHDSQVRQAVQELRQVSDTIKDGLDPLERLVCDVFHRIVRCRTEGLDTLGRLNHPE